MYIYVWADNNDTYILKYISIYAYTNIYTCMHTYTHIYTHTNNAGSTRNTATKKQKRTTTFLTDTRSLRICTLRKYTFFPPLVIGDFSFVDSFSNAFYHLAYISFHLRSSWVPSNHVFKIDMIKLCLQNRHDQIMSSK